jgi:hypothetical protein
VCEIPRGAEPLAARRRIPGSRSASDRADAAAAPRVRKTASAAPAGSDPHNQEATRTTNKEAHHDRGRQR